MRTLRAKENLKYRDCCLLPIAELSDKQGAATRLSPRWTAVCYRSLHSRTNREQSRALQILKLFMHFLFYALRNTFGRSIYFEALLQNQRWHLPARALLFRVHPSAC